MDCFNFHYVMIYITLSLSSAQVTNWSGLSLFIALRTILNCNSWQIQWKWCSKCRHLHYMQRARKANFEFLLWGLVISGVLLRLYRMGLRPIDPIRRYWQIRGWSVKVITEVALTEELKIIMVIPNLSEVKSHLGTFVRGGLKLSYPSEYSFNVTSWQGVEHWIRGREEENKYLRELLPPY